MDVATVLSLIPYGNNSNFKKKAKKKQKKKKLVLDYLPLCCSMFRFGVSLDYCGVFNFK